MFAFSYLALRFACAAPPKKLTGVRPTLPDSGPVKDTVPKMNIDYKQMASMTKPELEAYLFPPLHSSLLSLKQGCMICCYLTINFSKEEVNVEWRGLTPKRNVRETAEKALLRVAVIWKKCRVTEVGEGMTCNLSINGGHYFVRVSSRWALRLAKWLGPWPDLGLTSGHLG